ncbi:hypothetical protein E3P92_03439 [Wallemia ichthyophaga]|uniref:Prefoldin subunit 1 n=2 Tax=Wallemia ichthyophaga TaxID=245174 RepID=A0A4T0H531_WALIC|nr:putative prefoldin subunit 1 [Wallemia ichthyophaga EXF-994]TIA69739.1 hypothetical protein E3P91_03456 [Wallemia ichthyophaga]EOR01828.1 putative prefoldin subunit 1 [Wallemia ichthyophaga EXF-994]TIA79197.1 hypothetical protein E3P98_03436 [Wallemia ichthyophaga]TIA94888.1 hypothetical protein E3P96_03991 [Wallemia ichthyophaga]TIA96102.1 hypothetical protein E3P95_03408 [Wallemia ichthyophaga]
MSANDEALQKVLFNIQQQAVGAEKALRTVTMQQASRGREKRLVQLTRAELESIPDDGQGALYNGVGKMFIKVDRNDLIQDLVKQERSLLEDLVALEKKQGYMQKELTNAQGNLKDVFQSRS